MISNEALQGKVSKLLSEPEQFFYGSGNGSWWTIGQHLGVSKGETGETHACCMDFSYF